MSKRVGLGIRILIATISVIVLPLAHAVEWLRERRQQDEDDSEAGTLALIGDPPASSMEGLFDETLLDVPAGYIAVKVPSHRPDTSSWYLVSQGRAS